MKSSHNRKIVAAAAVTMFALAGCSAGDQAGSGGDEPIRVGFVYPATGPSAAIGSQMGYGAEIARQMFNADGGIDGRQIEWEAIDASDPEAARSGAERLVNEGIEFATGAYSSPLTLASIPVFGRANVTYVESGSQAIGITGQGLDSIFRVNGNAGNQSETAVDTIVDVIAPALGVDAKDLTVGFAGIDSTFGNDIKNALVTALADHGLPELSFESTYPADTTDFSSVALKVAEGKPDVLVAASYAADAVGVAKAMKVTGFQPKAFIGTGGAHNDPAWTSAMGENGNGVFVVGPTAAVNQDALDPATQARVVEFQKLFKETYGVEPAAFPQMGFDGASVLFQAMKDAKSVTSNDVQAALRAMDLPLGSLSNGDGLKFDKGGQNSRAGFATNQIQGGRGVVVYPENLANTAAIDIPLAPWSN